MSRPDLSLLFPAAEPASSPPERPERRGPQRASGKVAELITRLRASQAELEAQNQVLRYSQAVAESAYERFETAAMLHSTVAWWPTIHGYSGTRPEGHDQAYRAMNTFPDAASLAALGRLGVTHVIAHRPLYPPDRWAELLARTSATRGLQLAHEDRDGVVYVLKGNEIQ